jgi:hypothetical protein
MLGAGIGCERFMSREPTSDTARGTSEMRHQRTLPRSSSYVAVTGPHSYASFPGSSRSSAQRDHAAIAIKSRSNARIG